MQASVPELTKRILSLFVIMSNARAAISVSKAVGIPKDVPLSTLIFIAFMTGS